MPFLREPVIRTRGKIRLYSRSEGVGDVDADGVTPGARHRPVGAPHEHARRAKVRRQLERVAQVALQERGDIGLCDHEVMSGAVRIKSLFAPHPRQR